MEKPLWQSKFIVWYECKMENKALDWSLQDPQQSMNWQSIDIAVRRL